MENTQIEKEKYKQIYEIAKDSLIEQLNRVDSLDRKAQINLAIIGIILGFGLFKTELISEIVSQIELRHLIISLELIFLVFSCVSLLISIIFSIFALIPRPLRAYPEISIIMQMFENRKTESLHASLSKHFGDAVRENEKELKSKTSYVKKAIWFILIAFMSSTAFILSTVVQKY